MERMTVRVPSDLRDEIEARADADDVSESEAARMLLRRGFAADRIEAENDRLRNEKRTLIRDREEHTELVAFAQEERSLAQTRDERERRREEREDRRRRVSIVRRGWWRIFGEPPLPTES